MKNNQKRNAIIITIFIGLVTPHATYTTWLRKLYDQFLQQRKSSSKPENAPSTLYLRRTPPTTSLWSQLKANLVTWWNKKPVPMSTLPINRNPHPRILIPKQQNVVQPTSRSNPTHQNE